MAEVYGTIFSSLKNKFTVTEVFDTLFGSKKTQMLFFTLLLIFSPLLAFYLKEFNDIFQIKSARNPGYDWPKYSDFYLALASGIVITFIFEIFHYTLTGFASKFISEKYQGPDRLERGEKMIKCVFKGTYFTFASVFAYAIAKNSFFMPKSLGGQGELESIFTGTPYFDKTNLGYLKEYFMMQLGYHSSSLLILLTGKTRNDFIEMLLHHSITVTLLSLAYLMNYWPISLLILLTHDISDVFVCFCRVFVDTDYKKTAFALYVCLMVSWVYTRLYVFPFQLLRVSCYSSRNNPEVFNEIHGLGVLGTIAHILVFLHVYWFYLLLKMGRKFTKKFKADDIQNT